MLLQWHSLTLWLTRVWKTFLLSNNMSFGQLISGLYRRVRLASGVAERKTVTFSGRSRKNTMLTPTGAVARAPYYKSASLEASTFSWKQILEFNFSQRTRLVICKLRAVSPLSFLVANILTFNSILSIHIKARELSIEMGNDHVIVQALADIALHLLRSDDNICKYAHSHTAQSGKLLLQVFNKLYST